MKRPENRKVMMVAVAVLMIILAVYQYFYLKKAHSSFEDYYAFRGCTQLLERAVDYGRCKTDSGQTIKIVKYEGNWYLDGDLPCGFLCW
jgi:sulfite exporter TauE/SafE